MRVAIVRFACWLLRVEPDDVVWVDYSDGYQPRWEWDHDPPFTVTVMPAMKLSEFYQGERVGGNEASIIYSVTTRSKDV